MGTYSDLAAIHKPTSPLGSDVSPQPSASPSVNTAVRKDVRKVARDEGNKAVRAGAIDAGSRAVPSEVVEAIRKSVRDAGRQRAEYHFSDEEKSGLRDVLYTLEKEGKKTTANEVVRIALNWLLENYQTNKKASVLVRVLEALNS